MKVFITIVLVIIILSWFIKTMFRYFIRSFIGNLIDNQPPKTKKTKQGKQGDVHISKQPQREKKIRDDVGEYIDYEEIK